MMQNFDAIIIGAGPSGSSAAIWLAQAGWRVALIEKHEFPRRKVCGECIAASNFPLFDKLGIGGAVTEMAGPELQRVALMHGSETVTAELPAYDDNGHPWGKALGREYLDTLLLEKAVDCGVAVFQPWTARTISRKSGLSYCDIARVHSDERMTLTAPVMLAAHGSWEVAPNGARQSRPRPSDLFAFKANFHAPALERGLLPVLSFPGGYGGMVVGNHNIVTLACCIRRDTLLRCREGSGGHKAADSVQHYLMQSCEGVRAALSGSTLAGSWLSVGPIRPGVRITRHRDAIFRLGNAAGEAHPIIGEGMSMAFQSALLLTNTLAGHRSRLAEPGFLALAHQQYSAAWVRNFAPRIRLAALFANLAMRPGTAAGAMALLRRYPAILTRAARLSGKVHCAAPV